MKTRTLLILYLLAATHCFGIGAFNWSDPSWVAVLQNGAGSSGAFVSPTNLPGIFVNFDATLTPNAPMAQNTITDTVHALTFQSVGASITNNGIGYGLSTNWPGMTNAAPWLLNSNFTLEVIYRPIPPWQADNKINPGPEYDASIIDGKFRPLIGTLDGHGLGISNGIIVGNWGTAYQVSSAKFPTTNWINPTFDIVDAGGVLYTNGVACGVGLGQPTNNFPFAALGNTNANLNSIGYCQAIRFWTNVVLTDRQVSSLYVYNETNNSDYTNALVARWKMNDGSGTTVADDVGGHPLAFQSTGTGYPQWVKGASNIVNAGLAGALQFNSNYVTAPISTTNFFNGLTNVTFCFWYLNTNKNIGLATAENSGVEPIIAKWDHDYVGWEILQEEYGPNPSTGNSYPDIEMAIGAPLNNNFNGIAITRPNDGTWHLLTFEVGYNFAVSAYCDGVIINTNNSDVPWNHGSIAAFTSTNQIEFGENAVNQGDGITYPATFHVISDVQFYTNQLNQSQIAQKFRFGPGK